MIYLLYIILPDIIIPQKIIISEKFAQNHKEKFKQLLKERICI